MPAPLLALLPSLIPILGEVLDRVIPNRAEADKARIELEAALIQAANQESMAQMEVNKVEASHSSIFVSGWRPAIGWVCAVSLALYYIPLFIIGMTLWVWACLEAGTIVPRPELGIAEIMGLIMPLLGLGGLRSLEKFRGVAR